MGVVDGALVSPQQPTLGQRGYAMYGKRASVEIRRKGGISVKSGFYVKMSAFSGAEEG